MASLELGSTGPRVTALQERLKQRGFDPSAIDGKFGRDTDKAVRAFQQRVGLSADGQAGTNTVAALSMRTIASNVRLDVVGTGREAGPTWINL